MGNPFQCYVGILFNGKQLAETFDVYAKDCVEENNNNMCVAFKCTAGDDHLDIWTCKKDFDEKQCSKIDFPKWISEKLGPINAEAAAHPWQCICEIGEKDESLGVTPWPLTTTQLDEYTTEENTTLTDSTGIHQPTILAFALPFVIGIIGILPNLAMPFAADR
ncbi:hypothetical protein niasHS_009759 [Heterodera schachtii]|uniref:Uncharacterized protein n=1 Tax=Heterodera schachtii TaxID=97005 RepID=A0ABD2IYE5_HETSC